MEFQKSRVFLNQTTIVLSYTICSFKLLNTFLCESNSLQIMNLESTSYKITSTDTNKPDSLSFKIRLAFASPIVFNFSNPLNPA